MARPSRRARRTPRGRGLRAGLVFLVVLALALPALEAYARWRHLDERRLRGIAVAGPLVQASAFQPSPQGWSVAYLPRDFQLDADGLTTAWGHCAADFPGRTVLVFGDSTTRQASPEPPGLGLGADPGDRRWRTAGQTWAGRLAAALGHGVQVCVVAEDGYHPVDYADLAARILPVLHPDLVLVLLCGNDLDPQPPRFAVDKGERVEVYAQPGYLPVYPPLRWDWLLDRSVAFRFLHWRLAALTGDELRLARHVDAVGADQALTALAARGAPLRVAWLPPLRDAPADLARDRATLATWSVPVQILDLQPPWPALRREPTDTVHLSDEGHARVAAQLVPVAQEALAQGM